MTEPIPTQPPSNQPPLGPPPLAPRYPANHGPVQESKQPSSRRWALLVLAAVTSIAAVGAATPSIVNATQGDGHSASHALQTDQDLDLADVTLGDLASELEDLGLDLVVTPSPQNWITSQLDDSYDEYEDGYDTDQVDPLAEMTEEEIDALSDEEFFALLEEAGIDIWSEDAEWDEDAYGEDSWDENDTEWDDSEDSWDEDETEASADAETPLATFDVVGGKLVDSGANTERFDQANAIWNRFARIVPASERTMVNGFELMSAEYGGAHVYADENDPTKWILGVDSAMSGSELDFVLVHEFGHLLTLKASEVPPSSSDGSCPTFDPGEGCALSQSTLAEFVAAFWPQSLQDELEQLHEAGDWDALDAFYTTNMDSFVSDYATTNPVEDLAETFTEFVLKDRPEGSSIADQKVQMLWADQDMVTLRGEIRSRL